MNTFEMMHKMFENTRGFTVRRGSIAAIAGLAVAGAPAMGQDYDEDDDVDEEAYEWDSDRGVHEEEWYDPSDWFDDEPYDDYGMDTIDYEYDEGAWGGYYDGYYDGYEDDEFGYDWWDDDWDNEYSTTYTDGYYDGYYDNVNEYDFDPYYYTLTYYDPEIGYDEARDEDTRRMRGDRGTDRLDIEAKQQRMAAQQRRGVKRVRGVVERITKHDASKPGGQLVYTIRFDNRTKRVFNFGPKMTPSDFPIEVGERVTIAGLPVKQEDGDPMIMVTQFVDDGEIYTLRSMGATLKKNQRGAMRNR